MTVDCFVDDIDNSYSEVYRVLKLGGLINVGILDKNGTVAKSYKAKKAPSNVYWDSDFHTTKDTVIL